MSYIRLVPGTDDGIKNTTIKNTEQKDDQKDSVSQQSNRPTSYIIIYKYNKRL